MNTPRNPEDITQSPSDAAHINATHTSATEVLTDTFQIKERETLAQKLCAEYVSAFSCDRAYAKKNDKYFFIDREGNRINDLEYDYVRNFKENRAVVGRCVQTDYRYKNQWRDPNKEYKYSYIDLNGNPINDEEYDEVNDFSEGLAVVDEIIGGSNFLNREHQYHYIRPDGEDAFDGKRYSKAKDFSEGLAAVAFIIEIKPPSGNYEDDYDDGCYGDQGTICYIDKNGAVAIEGPFSGADKFKNGYAHASTHYDTGCKDLYEPMVIDKDGNEVLAHGQNGHNGYHRLTSPDRPCEFVISDRLDAMEYAAYLMDSENLSVIEFLKWHTDDNKTFPITFGEYVLHNQQDVDNLWELIGKKDDELRMTFVTKKIREDEEVTKMYCKNVPEAKNSLWYRIPHLEHAIGLLKFIDGIIPELNYPGYNTKEMEKFLNWYLDADAEKTFPQAFDKYELKDQKEADLLHERLMNIAQKLEGMFEYKKQQLPAYSIDRFNKELTLIGSALGDFIKYDYDFDKCEYPMSCSNIYYLNDAIEFQSKEEAKSVHERLRNNPDALVTVAMEYLKKDDDFNLYEASQDFYYDDELPYNLFTYTTSPEGWRVKEWYSPYVSFNGYDLGESRMTSSDADGNEWFLAEGETGKRIGTNSFESRPREFRCGVAIVSRGIDDRGFSIKTLIDRNGEYITDMNFEEIDEFKDGVARAKLNGEIVYIDTRGNVIFQQEDRAA